VKPSIYRRLRRGFDGDVLSGLQAHRVLGIDRPADAPQVVADFDSHAGAGDSSSEVAHVVGSDVHHRATGDGPAVDHVALAGLVLENC
jgi:hypothetical protein